MFRHIAYVSLATSPLTPEVLSDILEVSARNNERDGITGVLMHYDDLFFQVLEGESPAVEQCFSRVSKDPRHSSISVTLDETVEVRSFPGWLMGYVGPDEIGEYSDGALSSLADLNASATSSEDRRGHALNLARHVFKGFSER